MKKKIIFVALSALLLVGCGQGKSNTPTSIIPPREIDNRFTLEDLGNDVIFHTELQQKYLDDENYENVPSQAQGKTELSVPNPVHLSWEAEGGIDEFTVLISEREDLKNAVEYDVLDENSLDIYNLKIGTTYYWTVRELDNDIMSETATFTIRDQAVRNLRIPGVTNSRDIGGIYTKNGGRLRQDLIFRTANADNVTAEGKVVMHDELGVKTEIDLRDSGTRKSSPVGSDVNYQVFNMYYNDYSNYLERNCEAVKGAMQIFADEDNYPIFYHCRIGTDRTGIITYLLLGLCGCYEEDIYRDYLFSNFGVIEDARSLHGSGVNNVQLYYEAINAFPGNNLQEHIYNFLLGIGMSAEDLDEIIRINVEGGKKENVLQGQRALFIDTESMSRDSLVTYASNESPKNFVLNKAEDLSITAEFNSDKEVDADIYVYLYSNNLSVKADSAFSLSLNNDYLEVSNKSFNDLHCRSTAGIYVAAKFASAKLTAGNQTLILTNIAGSNNSTALGGNIAGIVIFPTSGPANFKVILPTSPTYK